MTKTDRTVAVSSWRGWIIPYRLATRRSGSAIRGNPTRASCVSSMSPIHARCCRRRRGDGGDLRVASGELVGEPCDGSELGGAHGREVGGVREQHSPSVPQPLAEADLPVGGSGDEVGREIAQLDVALCPRRLMYVVVMAPR